MRPTLRRGREFDLVYRTGRKQACPALVVFHLASAPDARVAFVASRKIGGAVQRNRAKRLLRAAFARLEADQPGGWVVLVARREIVEMKSDQVTGQLREALLGSAAARRP
jgi:ribonuclease P protein component